ncbi:MAG: TlpA family protein disulfide reductase [Nanoarchaeota archaeon]|nr:TlpA family protein disulfide reductase [DPANN group archaeon]MBL7116207.1 TlpA family protein disulfide reductase [Nanoarchaeota archaeon]
MRKQLIFWFVFLSLFLYGCTVQLETKTAETKVDTNGPKPLVTGLKVGNLAPDFTLTTIDSEEVKLSSFSGGNRPVLVYFFATWCPFCAKDFSTLSNVYFSYEEDIPVVASSLDLDEDVEILTAYKNNYPALEKVMFTLGKESVLRDYNVRYTTTKYAIGRNGYILYAGSGPLTENQWVILLDLLKNS